MSIVLLVLSNDAALAFSASSLEPAYVSDKQWRKVGVEVSFLVTAGMFENPENDWPATASFRARARVEVNVKKLSSDECAQLRASVDQQRCDLGLPKSRHSQGATHDDALGSHVESG